MKLQLVRLLGRVPYGDVVEVEQELIDEGVPTEEILRLCDVHGAALKGAIDMTAAVQAPAGRPAHTFREENKALAWEIKELSKMYEEVSSAADNADVTETMAAMRVRFNNLMDVEKHYLRKEYLLFPFLEKRGITGSPKVMWGKHDEARALLKAASEALAAADAIQAAEFQGEEAGQAVPRHAWADPAAVKLEFDAREMIGSGGHPMPRVMSDRAGLEPEEVYVLVTANEF